VEFNSLAHEGIFKKSVFLDKEQPLLTHHAYFRLSYGQIAGM